MATVGQTYVYVVRAINSCFVIFCGSLDAIRLPPGATISDRAVVWTPSAADVNRDVAFAIGTAPDLCGQRATQSWVVHVSPELTPPRVNSTSPVNGATGVPVITNITVTFSQAIDPHTVTASTFLLTGPSGPVPGSISASGSAAVFTPGAFLAGLSSYTVTVTTGVKTFEGRPLPSNIVSSFTTGAVPDTSAPTVPSGLMATALSASRIDLSWSPSMDNTSVAGYKIFKDGNYLAAVSGATSFSSTGLGFRSQSCYSVSAYDASGNESSESGIVCASTPDALPGQVAMWGRGLANGIESATVSPAMISDLDDIIAIAGEGGSSNSASMRLALQSNGDVWQLWEGGRFDAPIPGLANVIAISVGNAHSLALRSNHTVAAWGDNLDGQLGNGTKTENFAPAPVPNLDNVIAISAGHSHSLALKSDGTVWSWGAGVESSGSTIPVKVAGLTGVSAIAAGGGASLALKSDGTVWAWGNNDSGQLGDGTRVDRVIPVRVPNLDHVVAIAAGMMQSLALTSDGNVWAWGYNASGWLGDGTTLDRTSPVRVLNIANVRAISASPAALHVLAIKSDGTVWGWGFNRYGQLGDGTIEDRTAPVQVLSLTHVSAIATGFDHSMALR